MPTPVPLLLRLWLSRPGLRAPTLIVLLFTLGILIGLALVDISRHPPGHSIPPSVIVVRTV